MTTIGFVGLGAMGLPMARNLAARGFAVRGFDMRRAAVDALVEAGASRRPRPPMPPPGRTSWCSWS
jgi:3-hydroxyisobutyrate dehydrogenase